MRVILFAPLVIWAMAGGLAAQAPPAARAVPDAPRLDPARGAIRVSTKWQQTVFVLVTERERTVVATPAPVRLPEGSMAGWEPPPGYGAVGFWMELEPGRYELRAGSPGKRLAKATVEVTAGTEVWLNGELGEEQSRIRVSQPLEKIGPTWDKQELVKADVKYND